MENSGFTIIEILVVFALLAALAVGLLAALDPLEQIKKGTDQSLAKLTEEVQRASIRYYTSQMKMPWTDDVGLDNPYGPEGAVSLNDSGAQDYLREIIRLGELKDDFIALAGNKLEKVYLYSANRDQVSVCFQPVSKAFQADLNTVYNNMGSKAGQDNCKAKGGSQDCFWCIQ